MSDRPSAAIIGGGAAGLTAAYRLLQRGFRVRLFEAGGEPVEQFYHHLFKSDAAAFRLFDELALADRVEWRPSRVGVFYDGRLYPFTTPLDLLRFSPLSLRERVRLGLAGLRLRRERDGSPFENVSAADWVRRELGDRTLSIVWEPLLRGKFGPMWDQVVMTWLWNKIHTRFSSRGGGLSQREVLGYMRGSFAAWTSALASRIHDMGGDIRTDAPVSRIAPSGGGVSVESASGTGAFDAAVLTVSNEIALRMLPGLPESYAARLRGTRYQDALCLVLVLDRPLTGYYWLNVSDPDTPFVAVVEHTNLVGADRYGGRHIVYLSTYVEKDEPLLRSTADQIYNLYEPHLSRINPAFDPSWASERLLFHARDAQPVFTVGAGDRVPDHRTPLPGVYLANMAQIYPQDRGQNYAIEMAEKVAAIVARDVERAAVPRYQV